MQVASIKQRCLDNLFASQTTKLFHHVPGNEEKIESVPESHEREAQKEAQDSTKIRHQK